MLSTIMLAMACFAYSTSVHAAQTVPYKINFQGRLTNASGAALTGTYDMQFKLYTAVTGGTYVWGETRTAANSNAMTVTNGLFSLLIGEGTAVAGSSASLQAAVTANSTLYIEIMVGAETMTPRSQFGASAYAINSDMLDGLDATAFGQLSSANSWTNTNLIRVTSSAAFSVQNASGISMLTADTSTGELKIGNYNGGTNPIAGKLVIANTSNANTITLATGVTTANYTLTLPTAAGANGDCLKASDALGTLAFGACAAGVTTIGSIDGGTANANGATISGANLYLQSASASYAGLINTTTQTFAGAKTFNDDLTLATAKTITMVGGDTASRPASPVEGMMYYDTTTHQMVQWNGSKWMDSGNDSYLVAASNSSQADKDAADYVATGTGDQATIQSALDRADPNSAVSGARKSGKVYLFAGTYTTNDVISMPNDTALAGSGRASLIKFANIAGQTKNMITNADTTTGKGATVRDLQLDGNYAGVNTTGTMYGIYFNGMGGGSGSTARQGANIINNWVNNFTTNGIYLNSSPNSTVIGNNVQGNNGNGIYISSSNRSNITNNISQGNSGSGIVLAGAISENVVANTVAVNGTAGIYLNGGSNNNTIFGNNLYNNGGNTTNNAIYFPGSANADFNTITNNTINDTAGSTSNYAINFIDNTSNSNYLADNVFTSTLGTSTINDPAGTNNIYANQPRAEGGGKMTNRTTNDAEAFGVQNASGTAIFTVDTTNSQVEVGASTVAGKIAISDGSSNTVTISVAAQSGDYTISIPTIAADDTICLQTAANCSGSSSSLQAGYNASTGGTTPEVKLDSTRGGLNIQDANTTIAGTLFSVNQSNAGGMGTTIFSVDSTGAASLGIAGTTTTLAGNISATGTALFKPSASSASAFQIQNSSSLALLSADTSATRIQIGSSTADANAVVLVLDSYSSATDPTGVEGAIYYNNALEQYRCYRDGDWEPCGTKPIDRGWTFDEDFYGGGTSAATNTTATPGIGNLSWQSATVGTACQAHTYNNTAAPTVSGDRPGILKMLTSATATASAGCRLYLGTTTGGTYMLAGGQTIKASVAPGSTTAGGIIMRVGSDAQTVTSNAQATNSGVWWEANPTSSSFWRYCYANGTTAVCAASTASIAMNTFVRLEIQIVSATSVTFTVNGTAYPLTGITLNTATAVRPSILCITGTTATASTPCYVDYYYARGDASAAR